MSLVISRSTRRTEFHGKHVTLLRYKEHRIVVDNRTHQVGIYTGLDFSPTLASILAHKSITAKTIGQQS